MSDITNPTGKLTIQSLPEATISRISLAPPPANDPDRITAAPARARPRTPELPTDEEIEQALADARRSDPSGQNTQFYYQGYQSRENVSEDVTPAVVAPDQGGLLGGEARMYYHSVDNMWRLYPPAFDFPVVSDEEEDGEAGIEGEDRTARRQRRRDRLRRLGEAIFRRVSTLRNRNRRTGGSGTPAA